MKSIFIGAGIGEGLLIISTPAPKPAYVALQTLTRELSGYHIEQRLPTQNENDFVLLLKGKGAWKLAAWTAGEAHAVKVGLSGVKRVAAVRGDGSQAKVDMDKGQLEINLEELPQYIALEE